MNKAISNFGLTIRRQRKQRNLNQQELADLSGTSLNFISQLESGKSTVRFSALLSVINVLGLEFVLQRGKGFVSISNELED